MVSFFIGQTLEVKIRSDSVEKMYKSTYYLKKIIINKRFNKEKNENHKWESLNYGSEYEYWDNEQVFIEKKKNFINCWSFKGGIETQKFKKGHISRR